MPSDLENPYQSPNPEPDVLEFESTARTRMVGYLWSFFALFVLTTVLAPGDDGAWLTWTVTIEFTAYLAFMNINTLVLQMDVFRGRTREFAIKIGPVLCFSLSAGLVVVWTIAIGMGFLPPLGKNPQGFLEIVRITMC